MANLSDKVAPSGVLTPTGDGSNLSGILTPTGDGSGLTGLPKPHGPVAVSGATPSLDVGTYNFFQQGALTADTTVSFASVPTNANWQYSFVVAVSDVGFDLSNAVYASKSFSVTSQENSPYGLAFNADGTAMFVVGTSSDAVFQYTLSTGFDVSTAVYASKSFSVASQESTAIGVDFSTDGTTMFILGNVGDAVFQYTLSTGFDVSTASYASKSFSISSQDIYPSGFAFSTDGTKMYMVGSQHNTAHQYTLSTAWDVSTASYASKSFDFSSQDSNAAAMAFSTNGTTMCMVGSSNDTLYQYTLSTGFDVSTASYASKSFDLSTQDNTTVEIVFNSDGTSIFVVGRQNDMVFQYTLTTAYSLTLPTVVGTPSAPTIGDRVTYTFVTDDGGTTIDLIAEEIIQ